MLENKPNGGLARLGLDPFQAQELMAVFLGMRVEMGQCVGVKLGRDWGMLVEVARGSTLVDAGLTSDCALVWFGDVFDRNVSTFGNGPFLF